MEEAGDAGEGAEEEEGLLVRFVTTLQRRKVSTLEQLSAEFGLKTADLDAEEDPWTLELCCSRVHCIRSPGSHARRRHAVQGPFSTPFTELAHTRTADLVARLRSLEAMGYVTGVVDDRGKFIFISREELQAVSSYIRRKGRVRISTLAQERLSTRDFSPLPPSRGGHTLPPSALGPHPRHRHRHRHRSRSLRARLRRRVAAQESNRLIDLSSHEAEPEADEEEEGGEGAAKEPAAGGVSS